MRIINYHKPKVLFLENVKNLAKHEEGKIRKLSPRECARIQGFSEKFIINKIDSQAYKQFGNSVTVNVIQPILVEIGKI